MTNKVSHQKTERTNDSSRYNMKTSITYIIVAVPFHADAATHDDLARKVNEKIGDGYELFGPPFLSEEMMYQSMIKVIDQTPQMPTP
jgi:hypothetical protein